MPICSDISGTPVCHASSPTPVNTFLQSFNPALTGLQMPTIEQVDCLWFKSVHRLWSVSVDWQSCRSSLLSSALDHFVFPAMMETVLNLIGGIDSFPLIVDSGASCCISPWHEDFGGDYSVSDVRIADLSSTNTGVSWI